MAPRAMASITTKMSLRGVWTKTPPVRVPPRVAAVRLAPRPDLSCDKVALLNLDAMDGLADDLADGVVARDRLDPDLADVLGGGLEVVDVELVPLGQAVVAADGDL